MMQQILNCINNQFEAAASGDFLEVFNPATGEVYAKVAASSQADLNKAVRAAQSAFPQWSNSSIQFRSQCLEKLASLIEEHLEALAKLESIDNGKPLSLARSVDIPRAAANFRFFSQAITQFSSESHATNQPTAINYTLRQPLGVVACISPWNLPLYLFTWKIAPALAAGNTVIAKPSEVTPMSAYFLSQLAVKAGFPAGVLNILHGKGSDFGDDISRHSAIKAISFTGSTAVGKRITQLASPLFKKVSLEMGGKNPNIIFEDCDFEKALATTLRSSFTNQGQICLCGSRIYVQKGIYEKFKKEFVRRTQALKVGDPTQANSDLGAIVSQAHFDKIKKYFDIAKAEGGHFLTGGKEINLPPPHQKGWYIAPTIIENLSIDCQTNQEEIFGPVVTLSPFETETEVLTYANATPYGLSATIWTNNIHTAHGMARNLECGIVWINTWMTRDLRTPFGGYKSSGVGREGGWEALKFFTQTKNVCIVSE